MADDIIKFRRGPKTRLPLLDSGEPAFCTDSNEFFIGGATGNICINAPIPILSEVPRKSVSISLAAAGYFTFAETPVDCEMYSGVFKIRVTSSAAININQIIYATITGGNNFTPRITYWGYTASTVAGESGIANLRAVWPRALNNGGCAYLEFNTYNATARDITIELLDSFNMTLMDPVATKYNGTLQTSATHNTTYPGIYTSGNVYGFLSGTASNANSIYYSSFTAGEALVTGDVIFLGADNKWYKAAKVDAQIPLGALIARCNGAYAINNSVGANIMGYYGMATFPGNKVVGQDIFLQGQISNGVFVANGNVTTDLLAGYSYLRLGTYRSATSYMVWFDGNNRVYTIDADGNMSALDNKAFTPAAHNHDGVYSPVGHTHDYIQAVSGTYTPVISYLAGGSATLDATVGYYEDYGDMVYVDIYVRITRASSLSSFGIRASLPPDLPAATMPYAQQIDLSLPLEQNCMTFNSNYVKGCIPSGGTYVDTGYGSPSGTVVMAVNYNYYSGVKGAIRFHGWYKK